MLTAKEIKQLKKHNERALQRVIDEYMPLVKAICYKVLQPLGQNTAVEECVNDVFLNVWQNATQFKGEPEDFKKWLGTIAKFKAIDYYRKISKRQQREEVTADTPQNQSASVQSIVLHNEERDTILLALSQLPVIDRDIFIMKYYLNMANETIAQQLNLTKAAVDNRLYRGRKKLATILPQQMEERWT